MADGSITDVIERHPALISLAVLFVAILAYVQGNKRNSNPSYSIAGATHGQLDPGAVAIEQSAISAGSTNISTLAALVGLEHSNDNATTQAGYSRDLGIFQAGAARDVANAQTAASVTTAGYARDTAIFQATAARDASLAATAAAQEVADTATAAGVTISGQQTAAQTTAAQLTAQTQQAQIAANAAAAKQEADNNNFAIQAQKDIARAADNTSIVNGITNVVGDVFKFFTFSWL